jgi:hypothetical protein
VRTRACNWLVQFHCSQGDKIMPPQKKSKREKHYVNAAMPNSLSVTIPHECCSCSYHFQVYHHTKYKMQQHITLVLRFISNYIVSCLYYWKTRIQISFNIFSQFWSSLVSTKRKIKLGRNVSWEIKAYYTIESALEITNNFNSTHIRVWLFSE